MAKPKLLVLASTFPRSSGDGTPGFVLDLAAEQAKEFDVTVLTPLVPGAKRAELIGEVKVVRYRYWPFQQKLADGSILDNLRQNPSLWLEVPWLMLGLYWAIDRQLRHNKPALIHAHWIIPQGLMSTLLTKKIPILITAHGGDIYALNGGSLKNLKLWALERATAITTVNQEMRSQLISWGLPGTKVQVLPMGTDFAKFQNSTQAKVPGSVLAVGRLVEKKGFDVLIHAIRNGIAQNKLPGDFMLRIAGDGPLRTELEEQARGLPIEFMGNQSQSEISRLLASSEIFVLPSRVARSGDREGLPVTLMEAAASSSFVVASKLAGIDELVIDGESGLLVQADDPAQLVEALAAGLADPNLRERLARKLRLSAQRFDIKTIGSQYNELLRSLK